MKQVAFLALLVAALAGASACVSDSPRQLASTFDAALTAARMGELTEARALADRGLTLTQAHLESEWAWKFRFLRGEILLLQHQPAEVRPLVSAPLPPGPAFDSLRAQQRYLEALLDRSGGRYADALAAVDAGRGFVSAPDVRLDIDWLDGQLRMRLGQWAEAEATLDDVVARAAAAGDRFRQARAMNDLGMGGLVRQRWDEALSRFEGVLSFQDLEPLDVYALALINAGICYSRLGEFDRAIAVQRRSVSFHTNRGTRANFALALGGLGNTYIQMGDTRQALPFLRQAFTVARDSSLQADAALWAGNLSVANIALEDWNEAERFNDEATRLRSANRSGNLAYNTLNAAEIARGRGRLDEASRLFEQALASGGSDPVVRWQAHGGLANVALAAGDPDAAARHFEAALRTIEQIRSELLKTDYKLTFLTRLIRFYQAYVDALVDQGRTERALEVSESSRGRVLGERSSTATPPKPSATAFKRVAARSHTVLVSYWLAPARSYAWVVDARAVHLVRLPPAGEIGRLVREYQSIVNNAFADPLSGENAGDRLYRAVVEPVLPWLPPGTRAIIVPDGALHGLNFETLPVAGARRHYWIEDVEIQAAPALSLLADAPPSSHGRSSLLLIGDPTPRAPEFPALRYAAAEMGNVSKHFAPESVAEYTGSRASAATYRAAPLDRFEFVHFTAHAAANVESPLDSAVILAGPDHGFKLYARDVARMPLHADLVTVSACRSAGERAYSGEGLVGFAWAFLRAGASRVIAGLWDVDDRSTAELMDHLYGRIAAGDSPARALREAKLALLQHGGNFAKPYYWGPFQLFTVVP